MLPILPALLLLLLQGPSNIERLAREGRLPAALDAVRRELVRSAPAEDDREEADSSADCLRRTAIAAVFYGHEFRFAPAWLALLQPTVIHQPPAPARRQTTAYTLPESQPLRDQGFSDCLRTRDGPERIA